MIIDVIIGFLITTYFYISFIGTVCQHGLHKPKSGRQSALIILSSFLWPIRVVITCIKSIYWLIKSFCNFYIKNW